MIHLLSSIWSSVTEVQETKILFLGTSNSGKSALFERFKLILEEGPDRRYSDDVTIELEKRELEKDKDASGLGGLASIKAELEKRKRLEEAQRKRRERREKRSSMNNSGGGVDDDDEDDDEEEQQQLLSMISEEDKKELDKFKHVPPLPRFMTPTVGLNVGRGTVTIPHSNRKVSALLWDTGGDPDLRQLWFTYIVQCHGVVYCIDLSADEKEKAQSVKLLHLLMQRPELAFAPLLIVGTKRDVVVEKEKQEWKENNRKQWRNKNQQQQRQKQEIENHNQNDERTDHQSSCSSSLARSPSSSLMSNSTSSTSAFSCFFERESLHKTLSQFHRLLRFEDLPLKPSFLHDSDLVSIKNLANSKTGEIQNEDARKSATLNSKANDKRNDSDFVPIGVDTLLTADALDAVSAVPSGSVSGICGHMYHCSIANSKDLKYGSDLRESLYWILSAAQSSRARSATLQKLEANLSK